MRIADMSEAMIAAASGAAYVTNGAFCYFADQLHADVQKLKAAVIREGSEGHAPAA